MDDHAEAQAYWRAASDTFVAEGDYYAATADALRRLVLPRLSPTDTVLDIGCGDGTFSEILAAAVRSLDGFDLSPALIEHAAARQLPNARFHVGDALETPGASHDLVSCMGVLVCLVDDDAFSTALAAAAAAVRPGGRLLLRETVSRRRHVHRDGDYVACYRPERAYLDPLTALGFEMECTERLAVWSRRQGRTNHLWLLQKRT